MNWLRKLLRRKPEPPVGAYRRGWNLTRWKSHPELIEQARELFASPLGASMLAVLHASIPHGYAHAPGQQLGRMNGFLEAIRVLESLADGPEKPEVELEATWGAEDEFEEKPTK